MKILLIEDDVHFAETVRGELQKTYIVDVSFSGKEGEYLAQLNNYSLIILDLVLPDTNGVNICKNIRKSNISVPILILTGVDELMEKVSALDSGADDYLVKPFSFRELKARIRALLRREYKTIISHILSLDNLTLDPATRQVIHLGKQIPLRRKEFDLLEYMMRNAGKVLTREMILNHVWENTYDAFTNTVDVHIKYLRDRIDKPFMTSLIQTVHGVGYKIEKSG